MATEKETRELLVIAFSGYSTHKEYSVSKWLEVQDAKRNNPNFKRRYDAIRYRK